MKIWLLWQLLLPNDVHLYALYHPNLLSTVLGSPVSGNGQGKVGRRDEVFCWSAWQPVRPDLSSMDADAYLWMKNEFQRRRTRGLCQLGAHSAWTARPPAVPAQPSSNSALWWREGEGTPISREAFTTGLGPWKLRPSSPVSHCCVIFWHCRPWPSDPNLSPSGVQVGHSPRWAQKGFLARIK